MKNLIIFIVLSIVFGVQAFAQGALPCPKISVEVSDPIVLTAETGKPISFIAKISGIETKNLNYNWTVSAGTITGGQGSSFITIDTTGLAGQSATAQVEINGFPAGCHNTDTGTANFLPICCKGPLKIDEYGKVPFKNEKFRLDIVGSELNNDKEINAMFIFSGTKREINQFLKYHSVNISKYLMQKYKISKDRIVFAYDVGEYQIGVWLRWKP
jgi:hypothetical protein